VRFDGLEPPSKWSASHPLDDEADSLATVRGFMYLPGELTCALARAQLSRLAETTERSQHNARRLSERLAALPGVEPPAVSRDGTHVFHKYRVRLVPERAGLDWPVRAFRDHVLDRLRAEGVEAVLWQTVPLPSHPLFSDPGSYPAATAALDGSLIIGSQSYPLFAQPLAVVDGWADGIEKVWNSLRS
jgi:dTDP-4-amino-4,6-dideoxygalactose transaminase